MTIVLCVIDGPHAGECIDVEGRSLVLGRAAFGQDELVSLHHAEVSRDAGGRLLIRDLGSRNGTWVNDRRLQTVRRLRDGDTIRLGNTTLEIDIHEPVPVGRGDDVRYRDVRAKGGGVVAGPVRGDIKTFHRTHYGADTISGSRGFPRFVIGLGLLVFLIGFGAFAYPIVMAMAEGFSGKLQPGQAPTVEFVPWLPAGFGAAAVGAALMQIGMFLRR
jgi:hypothetical protein